MPEPYETNRERKTPLYVTKTLPGTSPDSSAGSEEILFGTGTQVKASISHPINRSTGNRVGGGPFYTSRVSYFVKPGRVRNAYWALQGKYFSGEVWPRFPTTEELSKVSASTAEMKYGDRNTATMNQQGATAIARSSPVNPVAQMGVSLVEAQRDGLPSLPGIQSWEARTKFLKGLGNEYLNQVYGWQPLKDEVLSVAGAARKHRDIMKTYDHGAGRDTHRSYRFPLIRDSQSASLGAHIPLGCDPHFVNQGSQGVTITKESVTERWFEGCFSHALPSSIDSWQRHIEAGREADHLFGLKLTPSLLWEATPWSWAVDWFSNAGDVINNVTNFGAAGQVMRYGYMMEETSVKVTIDLSDATYYVNSKLNNGQTTQKAGNCSCGYEVVTKRRSPANPFGFGVSWDGLSPTQIAITAALGITRLL